MVHAILFKHPVGHKPDKPSGELMSSVVLSVRDRRLGQQFAPDSDT
jgi:hypothetical protein